MITTKNVSAADVSFAQYRVNGDTAIFIGPASTDVVNDMLMIKSVAPKRGNGSYGNRKSSLNLIRSTTVKDLQDNDVVRDRKLEVTSSLPVGAKLADLIEDAHELGTLLQDPTFVENLFLLGKIEY